MSEEPKKPVVFFVDDEPRNLSVFEALLDEDFEIFVYTDAKEALSEIEEKSPALIVSDQRMPGMNGVEFLNLARNINPDIVRILVTGYSDEDLIIESVRKAQIFDYIRKPWQPEDLEASVKRGVEHHNLLVSNKSLVKELERREMELKEKNIELLDLLSKTKQYNLDLVDAKQELEKSNDKEKSLRKELEAWTPPSIIDQISEGKLEFPIKRDIIGINYDIINSSKYHSEVYEGVPIKNHVLRIFSEAVLRNGGWREFTAGDAAYAHFGAFENVEKPHEAALAVAREFKSALFSLQEKSGIAIECGMAVHVIKDCIVNVHETNFSVGSKLVTQKTLETSSPGVDLLHRCESLAHKLPGTNIILTEDFVNDAKVNSADYESLGQADFKGQADPVELFIIKSKYVTDKDLEALKEFLVNGTNGKVIKLAS